MIAASCSRCRRVRPVLTHRSLFVSHLKCHASPDVSNARDRNARLLSCMQFPPLLAPGSHVALVSPAGPFREDAELDRAKTNVKRFGWEPVVMTNTRARDGYLAGSDEQRARDLNAA